MTPRLAPDEILLASRQGKDGLRHTDLSVPDVHCGGCIRKIEAAFGALPNVVQARVNLSTRGLSISWRPAPAPPPIGETLAALGYEAHLHEVADSGKDPAFSRLVRALAVAGFASGNIMALSVSVWSGASAETRDLFHWISAAIALPTLAYSGQIFFASAWSALRHGRTNMDVPISIGVLLAFAMSLYDTIHHQPHAYFDAAVSLLFALLVGRTLDHVMRARARTAVAGLERLAAYGVRVVGTNGAETYTPIAEVAPGMTIRIAAGDRIPVDAVVIDGASDIDAALATGESRPEPVAAGSSLRAGTLNLTGPLTIRATAAAKDSFLAEMVRLMEAAEGSRSAYRRLADRAARLYAPVVHLAALLAFAGWMIATGDLHWAITVAVAVLIITCPCALGLAVPMVQVVAADRLYRQGIMVKDGSALERLAEIDTVLFDKTGTLTLGQAVLRRPESHNPGRLEIAAGLAAHSRHPYSRALALAAPPLTLHAHIVTEHPGLGIEARSGSDVWRLGRAGWATNGSSSAEEGPVLAHNGKALETFTFDDALRAGAANAVGRLLQDRLAIELISGDRAELVGSLAAELGIDTFRSALLPSQKITRIAALGEARRKVLMVGDGLNDAPALAAAHVSIAPANAADIGRQAADFVFLRESLQAIPEAIGIARASKKLIRQNFALAALYNLVALPLAVAGYVTPLIAAIAMSASSLLVVANALRLRAVT